MHMLVLLLALLIGAVAGLRALTAPAVVAWAAMLGWINLDGTWVQWLGHPITVAVLTVLALGELVTDQLPKTPSRMVPVQFITRLITGGFAGAVLAHRVGLPLRRSRRRVDRRRAGHAGRISSCAASSRDREGLDLPVALTEDVVAVLGGFAIAALTATL